jgi:CheY-like chemotaxis protein
VEDNPQVAELAAAVLTEQGHDIERAASAPDAVAVLERDAGFDLVFSDLVMPGGMDGLDLAKLVRQRWPGLPVLLATGYSAAAPRAQSEGFRLLPKPYEPGALIEAIAEVLGPGAKRAGPVHRQPATA